MGSVHHLPRTSLQCSVYVSEATRDYLNNERELIIDGAELPTAGPLGLSGKYTFEYDYPLSHTAKFRHDLTEEMDAKELLALGHADYVCIYQEEDHSVGHKTGMIPGMLNRQQSNGSHGIWGHVIEDLVFEAIHIDRKKKTITFGMGS